MNLPVPNRFLPTLGFTAALCAPFSAFAMDLPLHYTVLEGWRQPDGTHIAAIQIDMEPGWHTYWRAPGDAGIPPMFDFLGSENLVGYQVEWPSPIVFDQSGMQSVGYEQQLILPVTFDPHRADKDISLSGSLHIGVCEEICIPVQLDIEMVLPAKSDQRQGAIVAALASTPYSAQEAGVKSAICEIGFADDAMTITSQIVMPHAGGAEVAIVESANTDHWVSNAKSTRQGDVLTSQAKLMSMSGGPLVLNRSDLRITVLGTNYAVDIQGCTGS